MRKFILFLFTLIFIQSSFSFVIENNIGEETEFFSLQNSIVKINSLTDISPLKISYSINNNNIENFFNLSSCDTSYCLELDLVDLSEISNTSFSSSTIFILSSQTQNKSIYLDLDRPQINLNSFYINNSNLSLNLNLNIYDTTSEIHKVEVFKKIGNNLSFIENLSNFSFFKYNLEKQENLSLVFIAEDLAGNTKREDFIFEITDIFPPKILNLTLEKKENVFYLDFKISDDNLKNYKVGQNSIFMVEEVNSNIFEKDLPLSFQNGIISFMVEDDFGNLISKEINLNQKISISNLNNYINNKNFNFNSDADTCILKKINSNNYNLAFNKQSSKFSLNLNINNDGEYNLEFICQKNNYIEYFSQIIYLDTQKPTNSILSYQRKDKGDIVLEWTASTDNNLFVEYLLYRDNKRIFTGTELYFIDTLVSYPNEYEYKLEVQDKAKNSIFSDTVAVIPKKDSVYLNLNFPTPLTQKENNYSLFISTDIYSDIQVKVENNDSIIFLEEFLKVQNREFQVNLNLALGVNRIEVFAKDEFNNTNLKVNTIVVEKDIVSQELPLNNLNSQEESPKISQEDILVKQSGQEIIDKEEFNFSFIFFILFIILLLFIFFKLKDNSDIKAYIEKRKRQKNLYTQKTRKNDLILGKSLHKVKQKRIEKQIEEQKKAQEKKHKKPTSKYHEKKLSEISKKREIQIPLDVRKNAAKKHQKKHKTLQEEEILEKNMQSNKPQKNFFSFLKQQKDKRKEDKFLDYLLKDNVKRRWQSEDEYKVKTKSEQEIKKANEEKNNLHNLEPKEKNIQNDKQEKQSFQPQDTPPQPLVQEKKEKIDPFKKTKYQQNKTKKQKNIFNSFFNKKEESFDEEKKLKKDFTKPKDENISQLENYLSKRGKKKRSYFAEKAVEQDLRLRK